MLTARKRLAFRLLYVLFLLVLIEVASRAYLARTEYYGSRALLRPGRILYGYYPELEAVEGSAAGRDDGIVDVLFLGGSTLADYGSGAIMPVLEQKLGEATGRKVRVHSLAVPTFSSLDACTMYRHLTRRSFDLIVYYESINEVRANNCPAAIYKDDYSHYAWYRGIGLIERHRELGLVAFPFVLHELSVGAYRWLHSIPDTPMQRPRPDRVSFGSEIKTARSFEQNLEGIIRLAGERGDPLLLVSFAYYIPPGYTLERFKSKALDYEEHLSPIELWGKPENVEAGIRAHNEIIRSLYEKHREDATGRIGFVDLERLMPKDGSCFNDICHLTHKGSEQFVDAILGPASDLATKSRTALH